MRRLTPIVVLTALLLPKADAQEQFIAPPTESKAGVFTVQLPEGPVVLHVAGPDEDSATAWRIQDSGVPLLGLLAGPGPSYLLTNRVIVQSHGPPAATDAATTIDADEVPGFWIVGTESVQDALDLATELNVDAGATVAWPDVARPIELRGPTDPGYVNQWHLDNVDEPLVDVNAEPAWNLGFTGAGVTIGVVEGGWQHNHPDLAANYNANASTGGGYVTSHATRVAGVAAAAGFNGLGGVGIAYGAQVSDCVYGTESQTADAFLHRNDLNFIKTNSWGPWDNGTITYMPPLERGAMEESIVNGRDGKGTIFVWAAGNGGLYDDRVDYDPYASSRYTCAIGAIGDQDIRASYNEVGSSMLAVAHSSGNVRGIYTTNIGDGYTPNFGGTSSAAPLAAGVIALMLEANPNLTWRDVQHIIVNSARVCDPDDPEWIVNGAGHEVNYNYGYGALDAHAAVTLAQQWQNVPAARTMSTGVISVEHTLDHADPNGTTWLVDVPEDIAIEHVELIVNATCDRVGSVAISIRSPAGTESVFAERRQDTADGYVDYVFTSLRHWDESSQGTWAVHFVDPDPFHSTTVHDFELRVHGVGISGDLNCDGAINHQDVDAFLVALRGSSTYKDQYPDCDWSRADLDNSGGVDYFDIAPFVAALTRR